jgi:hypothetical protein
VLKIKEQAPVFGPKKSEAKTDTCTTVCVCDKKKMIKNHACQYCLGYQSNTLANKTSQSKYRTVALAACRKCLQEMPEKKNSTIVNTMTDKIEAEIIAEEQNTLCSLCLRYKDSSSFSNDLRKTLANNARVNCKACIQKYSCHEDVMKEIPFCRRLLDQQKSLFQKSIENKVNKRKRETERERQRETERESEKKEIIRKLTKIYCGRCRSGQTPLKEKIERCGKCLEISGCRKKPVGDTHCDDITGILNTALAVSG